MKALSRITILLLTACLVAVISTPAYSGPGDNYTISGDYVYIDNDDVYISADPHTIHSSRWVTFNLTSKRFGGNTDIMFGFNTNITKPTNALLQRENCWNETRSYTCTEDYFNYTAGHAWCWDDWWYLDNESTNISGRSLVYERDFEWGDVEAATIYWNETKCSDWTDITHKFDSIEHEHGGMNKWWYLDSVNINQNQQYTMKSYIKMPMNLSGVEGKYWVCVKRSQDTFQEAKQSGYLYCLDPWWNSTFSYAKRFTMLTTSYPVTGKRSYVMNLSVDTATLISGGKLDSNCYGVRFVNASNNTILNHELEGGCNTGDTTFWVQLPAKDNQTYFMYYGNVDEDRSTTETWDDKYSGVWHFNATDGKDSTDGAHHGQSTGTNYTADGAFGNAFKIPGTNQVNFTIPDDSGGSTDLNFYDNANRNGTLMMWITWDAAADTPAGQSSNHFTFVKQNASAQADSYWMIARADTNDFRWYGYDDASAIWTPDTTGTWTAGTWYMLYVTSDSSGQYIGQNGVQMGSDTSAGTATFAGDSLRFGCMWDGLECTKARIDEVRLSPIKFTEAHLQGIYNRNAVVTWGAEEQAAAGDSTPPTLESNFSSPATPMTYVNGQTITFYIDTVADADFVYFEFNNTNQTASNSSGYNYSATVTDQAVDVYTFKWFANDTSNNWNSTSGVFTINKGSPSGLSLNSTTSINYLQAANIEGTETNSGDADMSYFLAKNETAVTNPDSTVLAAGIYNYTYGTHGGDNWSALNTSMVLTVSKIPSTTNMVLNSTTSINYLQAANIVGTETSTGDSDLSYFLARNDTAKSNPDTTVLGGGIYNYTYGNHGGENYSAGNKSMILTVSRIASSITIEFNSTSPQSYGLVLNTSANFTTGDPTASVSLYQNGTGIGGGSGNQSRAELWGVGIYNFTAVYNQSENYTQSSAQDNFTITKSSAAVLELWLNNTKGDKSLDENDVDNLNVTCNLTTPNLPEIVNMTTNRTGWVYYNSTSPMHNLTSFLASSGGGSGDYNVSCWWLGNANYSQVLKTQYLTVTSSGPATPPTSGGGSSSDDRECKGDTIEVYPLVLYMPPEYRTESITLKNFYDDGFWVDINVSEELWDITSFSKTRIYLSECEEETVDFTFNPVENVEGEVLFTSEKLNRTVHVHILEDYEKYVFISNSTTEVIVSPEKFWEFTSWVFYTRLYDLPKPIGPLDAIYSWMLIVSALALVYYTQIVRKP
jgi:hypothetical protein